MTSGRLLAIDSSTERLCLAACVPGSNAYWTGVGGALASGLLLGQAQTLVAGLGMTLSQLDAIAFASGPGAFTGLRTACAAAQGLAFGLGCPVISVDSLMVVAEAQRLCSAQPEAAIGDLAVVMDARMGEVYAGRYAWQAGRWQTLSAPGLYRLAELRQAWRETPAQAWVGNGLPLLELDDAPAPGEFKALPDGLLPEEPQEAERLGPVKEGTPVPDPDILRAQALLSLAQGLWARGAALHPRDAHPLYVRDKVAQTTAERWAKAGSP